MKKIVPGDSFKVRAQFKNVAGDYVDPGTYYTKIEFILFNELNRKIMAKYTTEAGPPSGWYAASIVDSDVDGTDDMVILYIDSAYSGGIKDGVLKIQVTRYKTNANYNSGYTKVTKQGRLANIAKGRNP